MVPVLETKPSDVTASRSIGEVEYLLTSKCEGRRLCGGVKRLAPTTGECGDWYELLRIPTTGECGDWYELLLCSLTFSFLSDEVEWERSIALPFEDIVVRAFWELVVICSSSVMYVCSSVSFGKSFKLL